jgi:hypothetical protein
MAEFWTQFDGFAELPHIRHMGLTPQSRALVHLFSEADTEITRKRTQMIYEGRYAAELEVTLIDDEALWGPVLTKEYVFNTNRVRFALRRGDIKAAAKEAKVFELLPLAGE